MEKFHTQPTKNGRADMIVRAAFARFDLPALAIALGSVGALGLWSVTAILLVKGASPGAAVGPHLALLEHFLPAYSVSWTGSFVGLLYGFLLGMLVGIVIAVVWNLIHHIYLLLTVSRRYIAADL